MRRVKEAAALAAAQRFGEGRGGHGMEEEDEEEEEAPTTGCRSAMRRRGMLGAEEGPAPVAAHEA